MQGSSGSSVRSIPLPISLLYSSTIFEEILERNIRLKIVVVHTEELSCRRIGITQHLEELCQQLTTVAQDLTLVSQQEKMMLTRVTRLCVEVTVAESAWEEAARVAHQHNSYLPR